MKAEVVNPFITATINVFETMTGIVPQKGDIYVKKNDTIPYDISGVIGIAGKMQGFIVISFPERLVLKIVSKFLDEQKISISRDVIDAVGEFLNMIAGSSKKTFAEQGKRYNIGIPSVVTGRGHTINRPSNIMCLGVNFTVGDDNFVIEVALKENE